MSYTSKVSRWSGSLSAVAAQRWYEKAYADRTTNMVYAPITPGLCPGLAGNARFQAIIDRMGFPRTGE